MAPAGIDGGDKAVHKASPPKSSSQVTLCWREMESNHRYPAKFFWPRVDPRAIHLPQYKPAPSRQGPMVRIHLPPAWSLPGKSGSQRTRRWREKDSNPRSPVRRVFLGISPMSGLDNLTGREPSTDIVAAAGRDTSLTRADRGLDATLRSRRGGTDRQGVDARAFTIRSKAQKDKQP